MDSFDVIPGQHNSDDEGDGDSNDDHARTNPLPVHRLMRNQRESVAHFNLFPPEDFHQKEISSLLGKGITVQGLAFLPPQDFCFLLKTKLKLLTTEALICNFIDYIRLP